MTTYIALLRGVNVGGNNILPMQSLQSILRNLGYYMVETYIRSGNAVFRTDEENPNVIAESIKSEIEEQHHFSPAVFILTDDELLHAIKSNPFPEATVNPGRLHLNFLSKKPENPNFDKIEAIRQETEKMKLVNKVFYLYAPDGIGRSKLAANVEKLLGIPLTSRNWRTIRKLNSMARRHRIRAKSI